MGTRASHLRTPAGAEGNACVRRRRQRGNTLLELSLVLLPVFALMMALVDFSLAIFLRSTFTHAAREGARFGITYRTINGLSHSESIKRVVQEQAMGFLNGQRGLDTIQIKWYLGVTPFTEVTAGPGRNADGNIVEVSIRNYTWSWLAPVWRPGTPLRMTITSADRLEKLRLGMARPTP
jgi:Flp pilus assembly protein TadG